MRGCLISSQNHNKCAVLVLFSTTTSYTSACSLFDDDDDDRRIAFSISTFFYLHSFIRHVVSHNVTPPEFRSSYISVSTHFHVLITTYSSVVLSALPNHLFFTYVCHACPCSHHSRVAYAIAIIRLYSSSYIPRMFPPPLHENMLLVSILKKHVRILHTLLFLPAGGATIGLSYLCETWCPVFTTRLS